MLLDPLEEQFDLRATAVKLSDRHRGRHEIIGQKDQCLGGLGILEADTPPWRRKVLVRVEAFQPDGLVADQPGGAIDRMRVAALGVEIRFAPRDEESARRVEAVEARRPRSSISTGISESTA